LTPAAASATPPDVGKKREYSERILLPLKPDELKAIDGARGATPRTEFLREAAAEKLKRILRRQKP
jgi:hypothetical protein